MSVLSLVNSLLATFLLVVMLSNAEGQSQTKVALVSAKTTFMGNDYAAVLGTTLQRHPMTPLVSPATFMSDTASARAVTLKLTGANYTRRGLMFDVYINLPPTQTRPVPSGTYFCGIIAPYSMDTAFKFDVTPNVKQLIERGEWSANGLSVTIDPQNYVDSNTVDTPRMTIKNIELIAIQ